MSLPIFFIIPLIIQGDFFLYLYPMISLTEMPKIIHHLTLSLLFSIILAPAFPSNPDSLKIRKDSTYVMYLTNDLEKFGNLNLHPYDTAITGFQYYDPQFKQTRFRASLGNIGSANLNLVPYPFLRSGGFDYGSHSFDDYLLKNDSIHYYKILKTFTELQYEQGARRVFKEVL